MSSVEMFSASIADHTSKILVTERYRRSNEAIQQSSLQHVSVISKNLGTYHMILHTYLFLVHEDIFTKILVKYMLMPGQMKINS